MAKTQAIVYKQDRSIATYGDNRPFVRSKRYLVTVIDRNPDSEVPDKIADLPTAVSLRHYAWSNLNHSVYQLHF